MAEALVTPEDSVNENCPLRSKTRIVFSDKGVCSTIEWEVRDKNGDVLDLSNWVCTDADGDGEADDAETDPELCGQVIVRFADAAMPSEITQAIGWSTDPVNGIIKVDIPTNVNQYSGVYMMDVAITQQTDTDEYKIMHIDHGLVSIERGLFGDTTRVIGPPTIRELRIALRDTMMENSLLSDVEFDDAEIVNALARPLRQWNETPPPVAFFNSQEFPFHEHWLKASMALLMRSAAYWYERNNIGATHGGVTLNDRSKMQPYMIMAQELYKEWEEFIISKKVSINAARCMGYVSSPYTYW
jgi:hypothetical protein